MPTEPGWHIALVKSRAEKRFAWDMHDLRVAYFLPMERVRRVSHRKSETFDRPVYPGYVFLTGGDEVYDLARRSPKLCKVFPVKDQKQLRDELAIAAAAFGTKPDVIAPAVEDLIKVGRRYRVKDSHPFYPPGSFGYVDAVSGKGRVHIHITMLGASRPTEIDPEWLEPDDLNQE